MQKSGLKIKKDVCVDCTDGVARPIYAKGRCSKHYWIHRAKENRAAEKEQLSKESSSTLPNNFSQNRLNISKPAIGKASTKPATPAPNPYFTYWMRYCGFRCEETGDPISPADRDGLFAAQAHIIPKAHFPSVAQVLENHITLSARNGMHSRYDKSWESAQRMRVWPLAVQRFRKFCHLIATNELRRLPSVLQEVYDEEMAKRKLDNILM